jgi:hypothetical protein
VLTSVGVVAARFHSSAVGTISATGPIDLVTGRSAIGRNPVSLLPRDSAVVILVTTAECSAGRMAVPALNRVAGELNRDGIAFRVVVKSRDVPARQFARLFADPAAVAMDRGGRVLGPLNTTTVPTLFVLDRREVLVGRISPVRVREETADSLARAIAGLSRRGSR